MNKAATINARIEPALKMKAEAILHKVGLSTAEAIRIFYSQVCLQNGLPFDVKIPNKKTQHAMDELESGKGLRYKTMDDVWDSLDEDDA
jgi:DNA-damage-inducible protein J